MDQIIARPTDHDGAACPPVVTVRRPVGAALPVILASPHSGRCYPADFIAASRLDRLSLRRSEDSFVDEIFASAPALGAALITTEFPRAYCDVNREAWELDPAMFEDSLPAWVNTSSPRVGAGLGTIARVVANGEAIYSARLRFAEAQRRVQICWQPYHDALAGLIAQTRTEHGFCILIDCHSMPASATQGRRHAPEVVLGDAHGTSCAVPVMQAMERFFSDAGYLVRRNDPYAGGFVTRHYGRPADGVHVLQLELARGLYMNESTLEKRPGFARLQLQALGMIELLAEVAARLAGVGRAAVG